MNRQKLFQKLEEGVFSLRRAIEENDGSTLKMLQTSARQGLKSVKDTFAQNEKSQKAVAEIKKHLEDFEQAVKNGDRKLSAKFLAAAEKKIEKYKGTCCKDEHGGETPPKGIDGPPSE